MQNLIALGVAAVAATATFLAPLPEPPPIADSTQLSAADRTIQCRNDPDDALLINRRIARSEPGDELIFEGPCLVNQTIKLLGDRAYRGQSRTGTVIKQADGANLPAIFASDSYLENRPTTGLPISLRTLTIDGNVANNPTAGDSIVLRSWQTVVEDIEINGSVRHGIRLTSLSANGTILTNTQVNGRIATMQINRSGGSGLFVEDPGNSVTDWHLRDNFIAGTGSHGISLDNAAGWRISGNHVYGVRGAFGLRANRIYGSSILDNYIEDFGTDGIVARAQGDAASVISNNTVFKNNGGEGTFIYLEGNYGNAKVSVTGNAVRGNGEGIGGFGGIGLEYRKGSANSLEVVSTGNIVSDVTVERVVGEGVILNPGVRVIPDGTV